MAFAEDTSAFFQEFAVSATLAGSAVTGIFDAPYAKANVGIGMSATEPTFTLPTPAVDPVGQTLVVDGVTYVVAAHEPDGTGISTLYLGRTA